MTIINNIDGPNRNIHLHSDTVGVDLHPMDIYREMRAMRAADESLRKYDVFLEAFGHVTKGPGKFTERGVIEKFGTRIIPFDTTHELTITGTIITDDGQEGVACFDRSPLTPTTVVDINYVPPQVEVIEIETGSSALTPEQELHLIELWRLAGLDITNPMTVTQNSRVAGDIDLAISGDGENTSTVTRQ